MCGGEGRCLVSSVISCSPVSTSSISLSPASWPQHHPSMSSILIITFISQLLVVGSNHHHTCWCLLMIGSDVEMALTNDSDASASLPPMCASRNCCQAMQSSGFYGNHTNLHPAAQVWCWLPCHRRSHCLRIHTEK